MSDYPRDLKDKDGNLKEFKRKEDVPPGWFIRDTGEEVNPEPLGRVDAVPSAKKKAKNTLADPGPAEPAPEPDAE